jgi:hypothetical protein
VSNQTLHHPKYLGVSPAACAAAYSSLSDPLRASGKVTWVRPLIARAYLCCRMKPRVAPAGHDKNNGEDNRGKIQAL